MMRVVVGTPQKNLSEKVLGSPRFARPDHFPLDPSVSFEEVLGMAQTQTLLGDPQAYRLDAALSGDRGEEFVKAAKIFVASPHAFLFTEEKLLKKVTDALTKAGAEVSVATAPKKEAAFNIFSLTFALAARDRKKLWLLLMQALRVGIAPEAIAGVLHWKVRDTLAKSPNSGKAHDDLVVLSRQLVVLYHEGHRGGGDLGLLLERFVLQM